MSENKPLFLLFVRPLNRLNIPYMVTGSAASMAYGMPRVTLDIDLIVEMNRPQIRLLSAAFPPEEFYCPPAEIIESEVNRPTRGHFKIIHTPTGFKADCYPIGDDPLHRWAMPRRRRIEMAGEPVMLAPPEYVIIRKLQYFQEGGSEKHIHDIRGMLDVSADQIDQRELEPMLQNLNLIEPWARVMELRL